MLSVVVVALILPLTASPHQENYFAILSFNVQPASWNYHIRTTQWQEISQEVS